MEQFMMYRKAVCFADFDTAGRIMEMVDVAQIKALGREVKDYNETIWNGMRQIIVYEGLCAKFSQNLELRQRLLATGDAVLAECAVKDRIWGIGLSMTDSNRLEIAKWQGKNLLGFTLMGVREKICS